MSRKSTKQRKAAARRNYVLDAIAQLRAARRSELAGSVLWAIEYGYGDWPYVERTVEDALYWAGLKTELDD